MKTVTVTLNPSVDVTLMLDGLDPDKANRVVSEISQAGGKGLNVAKVLVNLGIPAVAFGIAGSKNFDRYVSLSGMGMHAMRFQRTVGEVRENITLRHGESCIKINRSGSQFDEYAFNKMSEDLLSYLKAGDIAVISGSAPVGFDPHLLQYFCRELKIKGIKVVLDCEWLDRNILTSIEPYFIKPNIHEFKKLTKVATEEEADLVEAMRDLERNGVENILLSLGERGILALVEGKAYRVTVPGVEVRSTVGSGDSAVAGFTAGVVQGLSAEQCLVLAAACGTATATLEGSELTDGYLAKQIAGDVVVTEL